MAEAIELICKLCGSTYTRPSPTDGVCWNCDRKSNPKPTTTPIGASVPKFDLRVPAEGDPVHTCTRCGVTYVRPLAGDVCSECDMRDYKAAAMRARRRHDCGISERHSKFRAWDDLKGPTAYMRAVEAVQRLTEAGDSILALIGTRGGGKSQLGAVAVWQTIEGGRGAKIVNTLGLLADLKRRFDGGGNADGDWLCEWAAPHFLVIDEVGELVGGDHMRASFTRLIDARYERERPTVLIGNLSTNQYAECVGASVADRTNEGDAEGLVVCDWPSFRGATGGKA